MSLQFHFLLIFVSFLEANSIQLNCDFKIIHKIYTCQAKNLKITSKDDRHISEVIGTHLRNKNIKDVTSFFSADNQIIFFPLNLENFFNLTKIRINNGNLREIKLEDLQNFKNLTVLDLSKNKIEKI
jgi:Leucine-rich repeat (LRR) protein